MKKLNFKKVCLGAFLMLFTMGLFAQNTVSGIITDAETGEGLIGANIIIEGTSSGTTTDLDGNFEFTSDRVMPWNLVISYTGYAEQIEVVSSATTGLAIALATDAIGLDQVIVSASRRSEKVTDAVASVTVLGEARLAVTPLTGDVTEAIRNVPGVNIVKSGTQFSNIELRGSPTVNESNTLVLRDYAPLTDIGNKRVNSAMASVNSIDLARIEVVRGPAGALYGPNVTSGVVHFISKDPFKYTGTDVMVGVGEQSMLQTAFRHAGNVNNKFGYKILASYQKSQDFSLSDEDLLDNNGAPVVTQGINFLTNGTRRFDNITNLNQDLFQWNVTGQLDYRFSDKVSLTYSGSLARQRENFRNQTSQNIAGRQFDQHQIRLTAGNFFVSALQRTSKGNSNDDGSIRENLADFIYIFAYNARANGEGNVQDNLSTDAKYTDISAQYNLDIGSNVEAVIGGDYKNVPDFVNTNYGINSPSEGGSNSFGVSGAYASVKYKVSDRFNLNVAARVDHYESYSATAFSPRIGGVFKIDDANSIRVNFSRASQSESRLRTHLDFTIPIPAALPESHVVGVASPVTFNNPVTKFAFGEIPGGEQFQLADIIGALAAQAGVAVDVSGVSGTVTSDITAATFVAPLIGAPVGSLSGLSATGQGEATLRFVNQFEVGYSGIVNEKFAIQADFYYNVVQNLQPAGLIPLSPGAQLNTAELAGQIAAALPNADQATIAALVTTLNTSAPGPPRAGWGLVISDRAQEVGYLFDTGFPTFGNENVKYFGVDVGGTYYFTPKLSGYVNLSYVSKNVWSAEELGEENPNFEFFLNTPSTRGNFGLSYLQKEGFYGSVAANFSGEFEGKQGDGRIYYWNEPSRTILDLSLGYRLKAGTTNLDLGVSVNNVFDKEYQYFEHLPIIRRLALVTLKASF